MSTIEILAGFLVSSIPSYPALFYRATGMTENSRRSGRSGPSGKQTPGNSGRSGGSGRLDVLGSNKFLDRRPVVTWNRITKTDDIDLDTQTHTNHPWKEVPEDPDRENGTHYRDGDVDHASVAALNPGSRTDV